MLVPMLLEGDQLIIVAVIVVVLIFGANKIPDLAKSLGRAQGEFQKGKVEAEIEVQKLRAANAVAPQPAAASAPASTPVVDAHAKLVRAATELGVPTDGRTDEEIQADIKKALG